jgi:hypothetical protein
LLKAFAVAVYHGHGPDDAAERLRKTTAEVQELL